MDVKPLILVVEDDKPICKFMHVSIEAQGYKCIDTSYGREAVSLLYSYNPDIVILDLGLPDIDGIEIIKKIREFNNTNIIVVSARDHERDKIEALDCGADDYLTKPFSVAELLARIRVAIRHSNQSEAKENKEKQIFSIKDLKIDFKKRDVLIRNKNVHLTPIEYKILELMVKYSGRVLTHKFIINKVWSRYSEEELRLLRVFMANIRRKIEKDPAQPEYILTEIGVGYRLID